MCRFCPISRLNRANGHLSLKKVSKKHPITDTERRSMLNAPDTRNADGEGTALL
jgi:hypothetical protein